MAAETACNKVLNGIQGNGKGKKELFPMVYVIAYNCFDVVLVNGRTALHEITEGMSAFFQTAYYFNLVRKCRLGIRNNKSRHEGMRFTAETAADAADAYAYRTAKVFKGTEVISMDRKTGRVFTGACEFMELKTAYEVIIFILDIFGISVANEGK